MTAPKSMDAIMALCKRRGFIYQASEIYGGINGFWDYGPLGAQLKKNLRDAWWEDMILRPCWGRPGPNGQHVRCVPVETCIIQHPKVWEASGHVAGFNDPMVQCRQEGCRKLFRADHVPGLLRESEWFGSLIQALSERPDLDPSPTTLREWADRKGRKLAPGLSVVRDRSRSHDVGLYELVDAVRRGDPLNHQTALAYCPNCGGELTPPRQFNLMFHSYTGAAATEDDKVYLRPETAQGVFVQFKNVVDTTRVRIPFGIGNTGRSFRNEVTPRNFTYRSREFEQAELEFFCHPDESRAWYEFWRDFRMEWWRAMGLSGENLRLREHDKDELSHYSQGTSDVEYRFPFTAPDYGELEGIAHRGCFDLTQHQRHSGVKLEYFDPERGEVLPNGSRRGERYIPHCVEPAAGLDRGVLALICEAYTTDETRASPEFLRLHPRLAPVKAAVFPLVAKEGMPEVGEKLHADLTARLWRLGAIEFDEKQSIGKRYARMDEAGCPFCFTIDGQTLQDQTVTVRDRDTARQERINISKCAEYLAERLGTG
jgi:glycyl-tRNA synthetase